MKTFQNQNHLINFVIKLSGYLNYVDN